VAGRTQQEASPEPVLAARLQARAAVMPVQREQLKGDARQEVGDVQVQQYVVAVCLPRPGAWQ